MISRLGARFASAWERYTVLPKGRTFCLYGKEAYVDLYVKAPQQRDDDLITQHPKYPSVKRDLALLLDKKISFKEVKELALRTEKTLLKAVTLFDVYEGEQLGAGKKSYAVSFTLQDDEKTLTDKQIDKIMNKLIGSYKHQLGAEIR